MCFRGCPRGRSNSGSVRQSDSVARRLVCSRAWAGGRGCNVMVVRVRVQVQVRRDATTDGCASVERVSKLLCPQDDVLGRWT